MRRKVAGTIYGIIASTSYGTNPLFALPLYANGLGVNSVLFYRYFFACVIYYIWLKFIKKINIKISFKEFLPLIFIALFFSFSSLTLFASFNYIESGIACTILFIYPIFVTLIMTLFFKEKISKAIISAIILTTIGIVLLYNKKNNISLDVKGISLVLLSALLYALYIVSVKKIRVLQHIKSEKLSFYVMLFGLWIYIINLDFCTKLQIPDKPYLWLFTFGLALFPTIISIETITIAIKLIGSTATAILGALEPLTAIFFGVIFFNEQLTVRVIFGIVCILTGVILIVVKKMK